MTALWVKVVRQSRKVLNTVYDRTFVAFWVRSLGVEYGTNCRFVGMPIIRLGPNSQIRLGDNVAFYSRVDTNPRGVPHPVTIATLDHGACIEIGSNTSMTGVSISIRTSLSIGNWVQIGPGACIWDNDGHPLTSELRRDKDHQSIKRAPIVIEDDVFIGARAMILKGVTIGRGAIVGAAAIVTKDVKPGDIVAGNPARVIGSVQSFDHAQQITELQEEVS